MHVTRTKIVFVWEFHVSKRISQIKMKTLFFITFMITFDEEPINVITNVPTLFLVSNYTTRQTLQYVFFLLPKWQLAVNAIPAN